LVDSADVSGGNYLFPYSEKRGIYRFLPHGSLFRHAGLVPAQEGSCLYDSVLGRDTLLTFLWTPTFLLKTLPQFSGPVIPVAAPRSVAARLLELTVRIPPVVLMSVVSVLCCAGRGLCDELITRPEESHRVRCV